MMKRILILSFLPLLAFAQLEEFTESGHSGIGAILRAKLNADIRQTNTNTWNIATNAANIGSSVPGNYAAVSNNAMSAYGWGDHASGGYLPSTATNDMGTAAWLDAGTNSGDVVLFEDLSGWAVDTNDFATAAQGALADSSIQWQQEEVALGLASGDGVAGNHWLALGYLAGEGVAGNYWSAMGREAGKDVQGDSWTALGYMAGYHAQGNNWTALGYYAGRNATNDTLYIDQRSSDPGSSHDPKNDSIVIESATDTLYLGRPDGSTDLRGTVSSDELTLDRTIENWDDIGVTFSNAVIRNSPVTITNNATWDGWTTDGTIASGVIFLQHGEYLISPVQSNGIARVEYESWSHQGVTTGLEAIYTNGAEFADRPPYHAEDGHWRLEAFYMALPGATPGLYVSNATITAYEDLGEAATHKDVSNLAMIDEPVDAEDLTNKRYVDAGDATERAYGAAQLVAYAADAEKTVRGAELRLGNMWVISPADASGDRFVMSGGEISGDGELLGTTNEFIISKNDYPLLTFTSAASSAYVTNFTLSATSTNVVVNLGIATNGVASAPFAEWCSDLMVGEWSRVMSYDTETYPTQTDGYYTLEFTVDTTNDTFFCRAMQAEGDAVATVNSDVWDFGDAYFILRDSTTNRWKVTVSTSGVLTTTDLDP